MKTILLFILILAVPTLNYAQPGTTIQYQDSDGPVELTYNGDQNGKTSYQGTDAGFTIDLLWSSTNSRWEIILNGGGNVDDLLFASANDTPSPPSTDAPSMGEWTDEDAGDGTSLVSITGTGTQLTLPVTLLKFTGENTGKTTRLNWQTAEEIDNSGFDVERSTDGGLTFSAIGNVAGRGDSFVTNDYEFIDEAPASGLNYYRLKQIDYDGQFEYSEVVLVDFNGAVNATLFPNPTTNVLNLRGVRAGEGAVNLTVLSNDGKLLRAVRYDSPTTQIGLDVSELKPGAYYLRIVTEKGPETQRFVKQ